MREDSTNECSYESRQTQDLGRRATKDIKTDKNLLTQALKLVKLAVETALNAELDECLGYGKHCPASRVSINNSNCTYPKL